jgi:hypothetical protein
MLAYTLAGIALIAACFALPARPPADLTAASARKTAPDFTLRDSKDASVKLSDYKGKGGVAGFLGDLVRGLQG